MSLVEESLAEVEEAINGEENPTEVEEEGSVEEEEVPMPKKKSRAGAFHSST